MRRLRGPESRCGEQKPVPSILVAVYLFLFRDGQVLMLRRHNTGYEDGSYSVIAGHVERDERITQALVREALEEAGVRLYEEDIRFLHVMQRTNPDGLIYVDFFFAAERWQGEVLNREPSKCDDLRWFRLTDLPENTIPYVREVLMNHWVNQSSFSEYGWGTLYQR